MENWLEVNQTDLDFGGFCLDAIAGSMSGQPVVAEPPGKSLKSRMNGVKRVRWQLRRYESR